MRLLFVTKELHWPPASGGQLRAWNTLHALRKCGEVDALVFQAGETVPPQLFAGCRRVFRLDGGWLGLSARRRRLYDSAGGRLLMAVGDRRPFRFMAPGGGRLREAFAGLVAREKYAAVWVVGADRAMALGWRDPRRTILDGDNYDSVIDYHLLRSTPWYGAKVANYIDVAKMAVWERQLPRWFARVVRCSEADRARVPARNVVVVPNGTAVVAAEGRAPGRSLLFVGPLGYEPNRVGMEWFVRHAWPLVRAQVPGAELHVAGGNPPPTLLGQEAQGVFAHGFVPDLAPLWRQAGLSVVPLLAGSGTRLKVLESLAYGVPCVCTSIGAFGLDLGEAEGVVRADRPEDFAAQCVRLLRDPQLQSALGRRGREVVTARYSWERVQEIIQGIVHEVVREAAPAASRPAPRALAAR